MLLEIFKKYSDVGFEPRSVSADAGLRIDEIIKELCIVNWIYNTDVQNRMKGAIEDYLFELKDQLKFDLTFQDIDQILEQCLDIARVRYPI